MVIEEVNGSETAILRIFKSFCVTDHFPPPRVKRIPGMHIPSATASRLGNTMHMAIAISRQVLSIAYAALIYEFL